MRVRFGLMFLGFLLTAANVFCQQTVDHDRAHRRYWYYRTRMINDFMKLGKNQGDCMVIAERNGGKDNIEFSRKSQVGADQIDLASMYIIALSLEYKLLSRNHQDTKETVNELYNMLYMINRLDGEAEQFWTQNPMPTGSVIDPTAGTLDGFMIRDDMAPTYLSDNVTHFNYDILESNTPNISNNDANTLNYGGFCGTDFTDELVSTKFRNFALQEIKLSDDDDDNDDMYRLRDQMGMPHDKFHSMLVAMMFVKKYLPAGITNGDVFQDGESDLKTEASKIAERIYQYVKGPDDTWVLVYPDFNFSNHHILDAGAQAQMYSWPLSRMACYANDDFPWAIAGNCNGYVSPTAVGLGLQAYNTNAGLPQVSMDAAVFMAWDQAGSNAPISTGVPLPAYLSMQANTAAWSIEWAELLRKVLHQKGSLLRQLSVFGDPINVAPCQGPYNYAECNHGGYEWSAQDRTEHPNSRNARCGNDKGFMGNYPGVDYMLLHNLYYEYQHQLADGNQGNIGTTPYGNITTWIYNAANEVAGAVSSALCSTQNLLGGIFQGNSHICDPTNTSGNGGAGSNNVDIVRYMPINYMDNRDENIWPRTLATGSPLSNSSVSSIEGTVDFPGKLAVFQNFSSTAHIFATSSPAAPLNTTPSQVSYRAGKEIVLQPGFEVDAGSTFRAFIRRYICNGNDDELYMRKGVDSLFINDFSSLDYESDAMTAVPVHYIKSPNSDADNNPVVQDTDEESMRTTEAQLIFKITPNPSSGNVRISVEKPMETETISLKVFDMKGVLILSMQNMLPEQEIDLSAYSEGIYMLQLTSALGKNDIKKISIIK